jgi:hypothetical protein
MRIAGGMLPRIKRDPCSGRQSIAKRRGPIMLRRNKMTH